MTQLLQRELFTLGTTTVTVASIVSAAALVLGAFIVSAVLQRAIARMLRGLRMRDEGVIGTIERLVHYVVMVIGIAAALQTVGINLSTLFAAGAVAAVAIGFATQNILQNFVSGVILLGERTITPTDVIEVEGTLVRVAKMGIRATIARTREEEELIIPNSTLVQSIVKNYTLRDSSYRLRTRVGVEYRSDMEQVQRVLDEAARSIEERASRDPVVQLHHFGDSSVVFDVSIWVDQPWELQSGRSALNFAIWRHLKEAGITIAFPQMDVHLKKD